MIRDDDDQEVETREDDASVPVAGYAVDPNAALDRGHASKFARHNTRVLPTSIVLRHEYRRLANDPKCGKRGAIVALARKYKVSQSAVKKALERKEKKV